MKESTSLLRDQFQGKLTFRCGMLNGQLGHRIFHTVNYISEVTYRKLFVKIIPWMSLSWKKLSAKTKQAFVEKVQKLSSTVWIKWLRTASNQEVSTLKTVVLEYWKGKILLLRFLTWPRSLKSVNKVLSPIFIDQTLYVSVKRLWVLWIRCLQALSHNSCMFICPTRIIFSVYSNN